MSERPSKTICFLNVNRPGSSPALLAAKILPKTAQARRYGIRACFSGKSHAGLNPMKGSGRCPIIVLGV